MRKIPSVFCRNHGGDEMLRDEVTPGCEWVLAGEGVPTVMWDGTAVMVRDGCIFARYDRKRHRKTGEFRPAPPGWEACEETPDEHTGHWPGWVPCDSQEISEDLQANYRRHREVFAQYGSLLNDDPRCRLGIPCTYELCGPHFQGNPHGFEDNCLVPHGRHLLPREHLSSFDAIRAELETLIYEGIVWHHPDGRMAKAKRRDFGLPWPVTP